jgi:hypothetical protein
VIRPGPAAVLPYSCPGGIVVHVYGTADGRFLTSGHLSPATVEGSAVANAAMVETLLGEGENVCLVFFDGDTGERIIPPGYVTGDRLEP